MINNLFSIFDPSTSIFCLSLNWTRTIIGFFFIPSLYWIIPSRYEFIWMSLYSLLYKEFTILISSGTKGLGVIFISIFSLIFINNFLGLYPYIFTRTRHIVLTLTLSLPLWLTFILYGWLVNAYHIFIHLVPHGTPLILISFIVCIETIRNIIRPLTLAIRLRANIIAGHLLIALLGNTGCQLSRYMVSGLLIIQVALMLLESAVAVIQSYVFVVLVVLYCREVD